MAWIDFADFFSSKIEEYKEEVKDGKELQDNQKKFNQKYISLEKQNELKLLAKIGELESSMSSDSDTATTKTGQYEGTVQAKVWQFFRDNGFSKEAVAGTMGNIEHESHFDPAVIEKGNGIGFGLIQWSFDRRVLMEKKAKKEGRDASDLMFQLEYCLMELNAGNNWLSTWASYDYDKYKTGNDIKYSTEAFCWMFERPAVATANISGRIKYAKKYYEEFKDENFAVAGKSSGQLQNPTQNGRLTSPFGMRFHPVYKENRMHTGIDLAGGGPIFASDAGTVTKSTYHSGYGNYIIINHGNVGGNKLETLYAHLTNDVLVSAGAKVTKGQKIATMGTTGVSTGIHLHYEVRVNGKHVDPQKYIKVGS